METCHKCTGLGFISPFGEPKVACYQCDGSGEVVAKVFQAHEQHEEKPKPKRRRITIVKLAKLKPRLRLQKAAITPEVLKERFIRNRLRAYELRAAKKGMEYDLTTEWLELTMATPCEYCGAPNQSVDRKDNNVGYTKANCVSACMRCNTVKSYYLSFDEMMAVVKALGWERI